MRRIAAWLCAGLIVLGCTPAQADTPACDVTMKPSASAGPGVVLHILMRPECLGDARNDPDTLTQGVLHDLKAPDPDQPETAVQTVAAGARAALSRLALYGEDQSPLASGELSAQWRAVTLTLRRAAAASGDLATLQPYALAARADELMDPALINYKGAADLPVELSGVQLTVICPLAATIHSCDQFDSRIRLWRVMRLSQAVHFSLQTPANDERVRAYQITLARWDAYRSQSLHQTWWELVINSRLMNQDRDICPRDANGQRKGLCQVPTSQLIVLHPDIGLRYSRNANASSELKPYLVVELLGQYRYSWKEAATIDQRWGYSLAAAYGFDGDRNRWAFGPMFRWKNYNLAITRSSSGRWGLMMNTTLSDSFFKGESDLTRALQRAGL